MSVWVLLMVLLAAPGGVDSNYQLEKFNSPTAETDCIKLRDSVAVDMAKAYPGDTTFRIECVDKSTPVVSRAEYDEIIKAFAKARFPKETLSIKVVNFKPLQNEAGELPIMALQIHVTHKAGNHSYIMLIKEKTLLGWIDAGEADPEEDEEEPEEEFPAKDQA